MLINRFEEQLLIDYLNETNYLLNNLLLFIYSFMYFSLKVADSLNSAQLYLIHVYPVIVSILFKYYL